MGDSNSDDRTWALLAHISYFVIMPFGALIIWIMKKETSPFVAEHALEALNFQLSVLIAVLVCSATCVGIPIAIVVAIGAMVYTIIATMEASKGNTYRYPYTMRLIT